MPHNTCTLGNWVDLQLLVVGRQIANLTPGLSFDHNLCFICPNGSCEPILDIYVSKYFQWYKKKFKPMGFDPCNRALKIRESIWTPTPIMEVHLGMWGFIASHSLHFLHSWEHVTWLLSLLLGSQPCKPLPWSRAQG
jgi:hypothetical protein